MSKLRIAILGISYEALLRSPVPTDAMEIQRGQAMLDAKLWMVRGMDERLSAEPDVAIVPLLWATSLPGGGFTRRVYDEVKAEALGLLAAAGRLDGVLLANHGAMEVHGLDRHADTDFAEAVRAQVGPDVPIAVSLDLHGHISPRMLEVVDAISVLRTAPHRDDRETGYRAADQLVRILRTGVRPGSRRFASRSSSPARRPSPPPRRRANSTAAWRTMTPATASPTPTSWSASRGTTGPGSA